MRSSLRHEPERPRKPWRVSWREDGRQRTARFSSKGEAIEHQAALARGGARADRSRLSVGAWCERWFSEFGPQWSARTRRDRAYFLDRFIVPDLGARRLADLGRADVRAWRASMLRDGTTPKVANDAVRILSAALGAAEEDDLIPLNPCRGLRRLPEPRVKRQPATLDQVEALRAQMPRPVDRLIVSLMAYAGCRPGELTALAWENVRPTSISIVVATGADGRAKGVKAGEGRVVPLLDVLREDLGAVDRSGPLVVGHLGWDNWTGRVFRPARIRAGVDLPPYSLRHTFASLLIAERRTPHEVAALMGHATPQLTLTTYGHLFAEAQLADGQDMAGAALAARARHARPSI